MAIPALFFHDSDEKHYNIESEISGPDIFEEIDGINFSGKFDALSLKDRKLADYSKLLDD